MNWYDDLSAEDQSKLTKRPHPEWAPPMLATLTNTPFSDKNWLYERKLDGQRVIAFRKGSNVRLRSRNRLPNTDRYPEVADVLRKMPCDDFVIDGEVVAFEGRVSSFAKLQPRMQINDVRKARSNDVEVFYYVFDLLHLDGYDLTQLPLRRRKNILRESFVFQDPLHFSSHRNREGVAFLEEACRSGWEGILAKRADSKYQNSRSRDWLKFKCTNEQEFVIGGFTEPKGSRVGFGALLIGYYEEGILKYAGKVGTGFDAETLRRLHRMLAPSERKTSAFEETALPRKDVHWVTPRFVAQIGFTEWTRDGKLRHPRFVGLRDDKEPSEVVREKGTASGSAA